MTKETTPDTASDESQVDAATTEEKDEMEALFAEAADAREGRKPAASTEAEAGEESEVDLSENAVEKDASESEVEGVQPKETTESAAPSKEEKPAGEKPADEKPKEEASKPADWRATLPPEAQKYLRDLEHKARSDAGRVAGLTKKLEHLSKADQAKAAEKAAAREAQLKEFREKYPEIAAALEATVAPVQEEVAGTKQLVTELAADVAPTVAEDRYQAVEQAHPGWRDAIKQPAFAEWLELQTSGVKSLAGSDEPGDAIALLDLYREKHPATSGGSKETETTSSQPAPKADTAPAPKTAAQVKADREKKLAESVGVASSKVASRESTTQASGDPLEAAFDFFAAQKERQTKAGRR